MFESLEGKKYHTIYADPPWNLTGGRHGTGWSRSAVPVNHYPLMRTSEIITMPVPDITERDAHLWLWTTAGFLPDALKVMEAWGFRYLNHMVWVKEGSIGLGQYIRTMHELCLFGVKGRLPYARNEDGSRRQIRSTFTARRGRHSEKPAEARRLVELVSPAPRVELFARTRVPGWDAWGNEV